MREIKFRAWDEQNKIMHHDVEFIRSGTEGNDWIIFKSDKQKLEDKKVLDNPYFAQQIKLMQFTGLKDKNSKDIFEGDRIQIGKMWWVVFWNQEQARFGFRMHYKGKYIYASPAQITRKGEIIGNIYESL